MDDNELKERYNKWYPASKNNQIYLSDYLPNEEECRFLLLKVVEQAVRDYVALYKFTDNKSVENWESAVGFLFDDNYYINWGNEIIGLMEILDELEIDIKWFRDRTHRKFEEINGEK